MRLLQGLLDLAALEDLSNLDGMIGRDLNSEIQEDVRTLLWQDKIRITLPKGFSEIEISLIYLDYLDFKKRRANMLVLIKKLIKDMFVGISEAISEKRFCF
jgi:hypothetical protein